ncbi:hypothetical protein HDU76_002578 [Blyttiomyces sp. JEL0837]|nr:hypothetical protein HDU76_002578 [Blyttiomyces sp. JEL0837]
MAKAQRHMNKQRSRHMLSPFSNLRFMATSTTSLPKFCPYATLGVTKDADAKAIKKAYYAKVFDLHPDRLAAKPGGAPKPGTKEHAAKSAEFLRTVKSWEILSDPAKRKKYDVDAAHGFTAKYAHEAAGSTGGPSSDSWDWDPRFGGARARGASGYPGRDYDAYYGPQNTGPLYMANWKMAILIVGTVTVVGTAFMTMFNMRHAHFKRALRHREEELMHFYETRKRRAEELGFAEATRGIRNRANAEMVAEAQRERLISRGVDSEGESQQEPRIQSNHPILASAAYRRNLRLSGRSSSQFFNAAMPSASSSSEPSPLASFTRQVPIREAPRPPNLANVPELDYRGALILAPMVRVGTLPMRMLALKYGADIVYSPETIDRRLVRSERVENPITGTVDFVDVKDGTLNLRLHPAEKSRLVVQLGSSDPENAVAAALKVAGDVAGIDLNCGCPKKFSIVSAMGAHLLSHPDRLCSILTALVENVPVPITCKIRMLETTEQTIQLVQRIEKTGVRAIALHCRLRSERPTNPGHWDIFEPIAKAISIPLIANGDLYELDDIDKLREIAPVSSFMLARGPQANFSIFSRNGPISIEDAIREYTCEAIRYDMAFHNAKYTLMQMWPSERNLEIAKAKSYASVCALLGLESFLEEMTSARQKKAEEVNRLDLLRADVEGVTGPDCPYLPEAPYIPEDKKSKLLANGGTTVLGSATKTTKNSAGEEKDDDDGTVMGLAELSL